jgi:hypothetical protein
MPNHKLLFTITIILTFFPLQLNAQFYPDKYGSLEIRDLKKIHATEFPKILRRIFDEYSELDPNKKENKKKIEEVKEYFPMFKEKFIVVYLKKFEDNRYCNAAPSYHISIVMSLDQMDAWHIIVYKNSQGKYEICDGIMDDKFGPLRKQRYYYLREYKKYWI